MINLVVRPIHASKPGPRESIILCHLGLDLAASRKGRKYYYDSGSGSASDDIIPPANLLPAPIIEFWSSDLHMAG